MSLDMIPEQKPAVKLVVITPQEDGQIHLRKFEGRKATSEAMMQVHHDSTRSGMEGVIEAFRAE